MSIRELGMTVFGLLCGSILFGRALPKWIKGIDVTEVSNDHNPGTANAMKYAGVPVGILCLLGDLLKGALPVYVAVGMGLVTDSWFPLIMAAPVLGHAYSLFYHGNGGKAIAVSFGVLIGLAPVQPELLLLLIILYLAGSALLIRPHTRRTRITYIFFALGAAVLLMIQRIPRQVFWGALLISAIVIHKNSIRQEFLEETTDRRISEETVRSAVDNSRKAAANYKKQLALRCAHDPVTSLTNELYALFMCHLMAGSETAVTYTEKLLRDVRMSPRGDGLSVIWMHIMPFLQEPVKDIFNYSKKMHIRACDFIADGFQEMHAEDPYEAMAEKMVYCIYNGSVKQRIEEAERLARITESDGAVLFAHWGCKGTIGASSLIKQSLEKTGLPTMILDGDGCNPANTSDGQVSTRLQAFVEMLEKGKEEKHA